MLLNVFAHPELHHFKGVRLIFHNFGVVPPSSVLFDPVRHNEPVLDVLPNIGAELLARLNRQKLLSEQRCVLLPEGIYKQKGIAVPEFEPEAERRQRGLMVVLVSVVFAFDDVLSNSPVNLVAHYDGHRGDDRW